MTIVEYEVELSCGCVHWYRVECHPFAGSVLSCPDHGTVRHMLTGDRRERDDDS